MFNRLFNPKSEVKDGLTQAQREAMVDLLHYCMYADNLISLSESRFIAAKVDSLNWDPNISFEYYQGKSIGAARAALDNAEAKAKFFASIKQRLVSADLCTKAFELCEKLFNSDGSKAAGEFTVQGEVRKALGVS